MSRAAIDTARALMRRRQFGKAIVVLENAGDTYRGSFDYYLSLGIACLYAGDTGNSKRYFEQARHIKIKDTSLLLGQAALFLRRGDTDIAIQYYLDVLGLEPENSRAKKALDFIRLRGDYETIVRWVDSGKIERFYPPLAARKGEFARVLVSAAAGIAVAFIALYFIYRSSEPAYSARAEIEELSLTSEEKSELHENDLSGGVYRYILNDGQIEDTYSKALDFFKSYRDNSARVQVNRLLNSNASAAVKAKASLLQSYFETPSFDTLTSLGEENFRYADVASDPVLYDGCFVVWAGRITNAQTQDGAYRCDLLVGYENMERVDGIVPVYFSPPPAPEIEGGRAVRILARISIEKNGRLSLLGQAVYQPVAKEE